LWKLPLRLALDWFAAGLFVVNGNSADAKAVLSAHVEFFKNLKSDVAKRRTLAKKIRGFEVKRVYRNLLPVQFFLLKHKTFGDLAKF
jgi:hypothetical protein